MRAASSGESIFAGIRSVDVFSASGTTNGYLFVRGVGHVDVVITSAADGADSRTVAVEFFVAIIGYRRFEWLASSSVYTGLPGVRCLGQYFVAVSVNNSFGYGAYACRDECVTQVDEPALSM
ncbi:hypothetical protein B0X70_05590 [Photorhabdus akhurstii]|uniref:Uncharacterized protein n=1 Tax=Photorhabdus akhurstii TaxID=171438 RepID=A0ABX8LRZ4_9GAMM|nr:hypothetical protein B0X70_05590 [Photorhabdus akhurstii]